MTLDEAVTRGQKLAQGNEVAEAPVEKKKKKK